MNDWFSKLGPEAQEQIRREAEELKRNNVELTPEQRETGQELLTIEEQVQAAELETQRFAYADLSPEQAEQEIFNRRNPMQANSDVQLHGHLSGAFAREVEAKEQATAATPQREGVDGDYQGYEQWYDDFHKNDPLPQPDELEREIDED